MMTSIRAPPVWHHPNGSFWLGSLLAKACSTASRLSSGNRLVQVPGPVDGGKLLSRGRPR